MTGTEQLLAELAALNQRVDKLLSLNLRLGEENTALRQLKAQLADERMMLIQKNEQARARIEAMISKLKAMEGSVV
jgi:cell division protein ZapB